MWIIMARDLDDNSDEFVCIQENREEAIEMWFPDGIDDMNREPQEEQMFENKRYYMIPMDTYRHDLILSLINDCVIDYKFENRW